MTNTQTTATATADYVPSIREMLAMGYALVDGYWTCTVTGRRWVAPAKRG
jgi:hypothetical protein